MSDDEFEAKLADENVSDEVEENSKEESLSAEELERVQTLELASKSRKSFKLGKDSDQCRKTNCTKEAG